MKNDLDLKKIAARLKDFKGTAIKHGAFIVLVFVLLVYVIVVWRINQLATVEPSEEQASAALDTVKVPKVDKNAINKIQSLENSSPDLHSLFNSARNNPFQE
jgi:predicted negative regulator of RcsB-dependent stress response